MSNCLFCSGKHIKADSVGDGIRTMKTMLEGLLSIGVMRNNQDEDRDHADGGILLKNGNQLAFDNSSGEYAEMTVQIRYCPFCGKELDTK